MKTYLAVTAALFGLLAVVHLWRMIVEFRSLGTDPWFLIITVIAALLCGWGARLYFQARNQSAVRGV